VSEAIDLVPLIRQQFAEDMLPADHDYWDVLELVRPSEEVRDLTKEESSKRLQMVIPLQNFIEIYSILCADIISEVMYKNLLKQEESEDVPEDYVKAWHKTTITQNREIVRGSVYPIIAHMIQSGTLVYGQGAKYGILGI
jgi:hypothetical protein